MVEARAIDLAERYSLKLKAILTPMQFRVLQLAAEGMSNTVIGRELYIQPRTVERHLSDIYDRLLVSQSTAPQYSGKPIYNQRAISVRRYLYEYGFGSTYRWFE